MGCGTTRFDRGAQKPPKLEEFWLKICPWGIQGAADLGFWGTAIWGLRGRNMETQGAATLIEHLSALSFPAVPWGPFGAPWGPISCFFRLASKSQVHFASKSLGSNLETKSFKFRWFLGPSDQNELYHTPLISKIWDLGNRFLFGGWSL